MALGSTDARAAKARSSRSVKGSGPGDTTSRSAPVSDFGSSSKASGLPGGDREHDSTGCVVRVGPRLRNRATPELQRRSMA